MLANDTHTTNVLPLILLIKHFFLLFKLNYLKHLFICIKWQVEVEDQSQVEYGATLGMIRSMTSVCDVKTNDGSVCGKEFKDQYPTNLKKNLKTSHSDEYKCFEAAEIERTKEKERKGSSRLKQSTLPVCVLGSKSYDINSRKHKAITFHLATFIGASNVPLALVDKSEFRGLIWIPGTVCFIEIKWKVK